MAQVLIQFIQWLESPSFTILALAGMGFYLAVQGRDIPPNLTRICDVALGGGLGLMVPKVKNFLGNNKNRKDDDN